MGTGPTIRMARGGDVGAFLDYLVQHVAESGRDGSPYFATSRTIQREEARESALTRWRRPLDEPLWGRAWLLFDVDARTAVGHLELRGGRVRAEMHRAVLAMGLLRPFTGHGYGRVLLDTAIAWARDDAKLASIDLGVFSNNAPARKLYGRAGFVEVGLRRDAFRLDGDVSLDDIQMALRIEHAARGD